MKRYKVIYNQTQADIKAGNDVTFNTYDSLTEAEDAANFLRDDKVVAAWVESYVER